MDKRGRPPYPDILTPREREVLELLRDGLSNPQIAERLGITLDGAKYHVSEILGKLGVNSREEAARWRPEERRPWWAVAFAPVAFAWRRAGGLTPSLSGAALAASAAVAVAMLGGLALIAVLLLREGSGDGPRMEIGATPDEIYRAVLEGMNSPGAVLHTEIETTIVSEGESAPAYTQDLWIDAPGETLRVEFHKNPGWQAEIDDESTNIVVGRYMYVPDDPGEALRFEFETLCPGTSSTIIASLLGCSSLFLESVDLGDQPAINPDSEFGGRAAVAIVFEGTRAQTPDADTTVRIFLDVDTFLPMAQVIEFKRDGTSWQIVAIYQNEFISSDQLPADFLDPRSIGYGVENADDLLDQMAQDVPVYWVGEEFEPGGGFDPLVLTTVNLGNINRLSRHLFYETPRGIHGSYIFLWTPSEWQALMAGPHGQLLADTRCVTRLDVDVEGMQVAFYFLPRLTYPLETEPRTTSEECQLRVVEQFLMAHRIIAVVELEDVVVDVRSHVTGHHNSFEAMEAILKGLRRR